MGNGWSVDASADGVSRVVVTAEMDLALEEPLVALVAERLAGGATARVLLDLGAVRFIDSSGVRALLRVHLDHGDAVQLTAVSDSVRQVLDIAGLGQLLPPNGTAR